MAGYPPNKLVPSIASESLSEVMSLIADTSLDAVIDSGALDSIPVIGIATGIARAARDVHEAFLLRKLAVFLKETAQLSVEERKSFESKFSSEAAQEDFGGALLVLIDRAEDIEKPRILGRLLAAHIRGAYGQVELMRMCKMVDRSYVEDLMILKGFSFGLQPGNEIPAQSLSATGFLYQAGFDGGNVDDGSGGIMYAITHYGEWLAAHGLEN